MPLRYARHYYDLDQLAHSEYKDSALAQLDLLDKVVVFKMRFYPRGWAEYEKARPGTLKLIPPNYRLKSLEEDYEMMRAMVFGEYLAFDELIGSLQNLEAEINSIKDN